MLTPDQKIFIKEIEGVTNRKLTLQEKEDAQAVYDWAKAIRIYYEGAVTRLSLEDVQNYLEKPIHGSFKKTNKRFKEELKSILDIL